MGRPKGSKNKAKLPVSTGEPITFGPGVLTTYSEQYPAPSVSLVKPDPTIKYQIVEVDKPRPTQGWDKENRENVVVLKEHPGFIYLLNKLAYQTALLKATLELPATNQGRHKDMRDVEFLQSGIYWTKWLKNQIDAATQRVRSVPQPALDEEERAFKELQATLNKVGGD
jgi:hypothetical protein